MMQGRTIQFAAFALLILVYIAARIRGLTASCLWFDEIFSVHAAEHPWNSILSFVSLDLIHPPLFYAMLKVWIAIGGDGLLWLRWLPTAISVIAVFPFIALCRELKLPFSTQILALFLFAVNGSLIKYAQEVRMYSLLMCLSLFSIWLFTRFFRSGAGLIPLILINVLMIYTHYFGWLVLLTEMGFTLWLRRSRWREVVIMSTVAAAAFVPWAIAVASAAASGSEIGQNIGWMSRPGPVEIVDFVLDAVEPFYYRASSSEPISYFVISIPILMLVGAAMVGFLIKERSDLEKQALNLFIAFTVIPISIAFIVSWLTSYSIWGTRHLIIVFPPMLILSALFLSGIDKMAIRRISVTGLVILVAIGLAVNVSRPTQEYSWCSWEPLTTDWILDSHYSSKPKQVYAAEELIGYHIWFAARKSPGHKINVMKGLPGTREDAAYFLPRGFEEVNVVDFKRPLSADEFWIAFRNQEPNTDVSEIPFIDPPPGVITGLGQLGFELENIQKKRVGNETAFFGKMKRREELAP